MIVRPENMDFSKQTFSAIIYAPPGLGKTSLALSAPSPLLLDFDRGISRVQARHRCPAITPENYEEVLNDIQSSDISEFETIVIDTGGAFVSFLKDWAFRNFSDARTRANTWNNMAGFAHVKSEFSHFTDLVKTVLNKNVIYVFHSVEQADRDGNPTQRLMCEGSARNTVWTPCDFGGYMQMLDGERTITFSPTQEFFAKGTHGIHGKYIVPELDENTPNDFMTRLFEKARQNIIAENEAYAPVREQYGETMKIVRGIVDAVTDADSATAAVQTILGLEHAMTSKKEASALLNARAESLGLKYDKESQKYIKREGA